MIKINFSYRIDSLNWVESFAILPITHNTSEDDIDHLISEIIRVKNRNIPYREFGYKITNQEKVEE